MASVRCTNKRDYMELISYCDMGFGALTIFFSTLIFINSLPISREGHEFAHDVITVIFMASIVIHFLQLFQAVRLLNSTENQNYQEDPEAAIRLSDSWQNCNIFFVFLLLIKFYIVRYCASVTFVLYSIFIGLELCFRIHSRYAVKEFIYEIEANASNEAPYYSPYLWN